MAVFFNCLKYFRGSERCPGTFSQSIVYWRGPYHFWNGFSLFVSFDCDSLSEVVRKKRKEEIKTFAGELSQSASGSLADGKSAAPNWNILCLELDVFAY